MIWIWFEHKKGPYYFEEDQFNTIAEAEKFWHDDPFFISAERVGAEPPIVAEYRKSHPTYDPSR